ncbi:MAG TPA: PCYCGC motif-containing (lipo)protein [candidate division Zixibacteria bacterium]|nr:PCYCGC motif-containing (lipo)protein [candidate division Zixibacteria bacterium]
MKLLYRFLPQSLATLLISGVVLAGCSAEGKAGAANHDLAMAPLAQMPADVQQSPVVVQQAYQFAVANPEVLKQIPCYCGCGAMGHTSNYSCYVADVGAGGDVVFDNHALGCSICVDISQDAMRMLDQGKEIPEIFAYVDSTYARFGPPTPLEK